LTLCRFNCPLILFIMLTKSYIRKVSPTAMKTLREIITSANVQALVDNDQARIDALNEIYALYVSVEVSLNNKHLKD
tara:strand:+ start:1621 stop:1851 length:231 start_codon:yes stop_codon:yes gene_type:complete